MTGFTLPLLSNGRTNAERLDLSNKKSPTGDCSSNSPAMTVPPPPTVPDSWLPHKLGRSRRGRLLDCADVPSRQKIPFILWGYRPAPKGPCGLFQTVFSLHNETGNMWTHLLGFFYFAWVATDLTLLLVRRDTSPVDQAEALWVLLLVAATGYCLFCSFMFHLCSCTGTNLRECTYKMDLTGIVTLIAVSYFTGIALGYRCHPELRGFYLMYAACVSLALAVPVVRPNLVEDMPRHFILCCVLGLVPAVHFTCVASQKEIDLLLPYLLNMFGCYGVGAMFYVSRFPESRWPGHFDILGHSHQFWHLFVLLAAASWVQGCWVMMLQKAECEVPVATKDTSPILP
eukprot:gb/GFBE01030915.1/.p1 GENE.gb/GFBE01030915.1/~~gb/GFBE01030915.1/.p1  ORF type:complete len:343 (+),score=35.73 gb/GFBE01030915.1/:1-1029(+)